MKSPGFLYSFNHIPSNYVMIPNNSGLNPILGHAQDSETCRVPHFSCPQIPDHMTKEMGPVLLNKI